MQKLEKTGGDTDRTLPTYERAALRERILHIGFGAFARAFLTTILDETLDATKDPAGRDWGMVAVRLNSGVEDLDALERDDCRHWVLAADDERTDVRRVDAVIATCHPLRDGLAALLGRFTRPELAIVSLTITEKGYCTRDGRLDPEHAGILGDLATPLAPATAIGVLVEGLRLRRAAGLAGLTVLSCDNLPENGHVCRAAVLDFARARDEGLAAWIEANVSFPCTMVDRIVPALDTDGRDMLARAGIAADAGIVCEPFRQWVVEDDFAAGRPDFSIAGARFVDDVRPFEEMKLRMLNGSHTFLACLGQIAGHATIAECMDDPLFRAAARGLMLEEQAPTLSLPDGHDLAAYAEALLARFSNSRLKHRTAQIATDTSQKLPQRLLAPIRRHLATGTPWPRLALGVAGWLAFCRGKDEAGVALALNDPLSGRIAEIVAGNDDGPGYVRAILALDAVVPADLAANADFVSLVEAAYLELRREGVRATLARLADAPRSPA